MKATKKSNVNTSVSKPIVEQKKSEFIVKCKKIKNTSTNAANAISSINNIPTSNDIYYSGMKESIIKDIFNRWEIINRSILVENEEDITAEKAREMGTRTELKRIMFNIRLNNNDFDLVDSVPDKIYTHIETTLKNLGYEINKKVLSAGRTYFIIKW
ncbi:MAG: hypothetical protein Satyrvirus31_6 [Satyrvirus sp.]|uniref:Uncharacterized protein n=1 Tax=Satyrvirus sp. TaxID=2487771 RepID=A0A3G5AET0_9VIRU|nr:MAG: hypothetical protein Satyrvirus31_6 [Satyrvirus sp.]